MAKKAVQWVICRSCGGRGTLNPGRPWASHCDDCNGSGVVPA